MKEKRRERLEAIRMDAVARDEKNASLTPKQKLGKLDRRLGKGIGAKKERARLQKLLNKGE